jgi:dihydropyrimidinase
VGGKLDVLATDHCPFTSVEKQDHADFTTVPGGLPSIEARLSLAYHSGQQNHLGLQRWVEVCCTNPARIFGLSHKGSIAPGYDADLVIFDPEQQRTLRANETLHENVDWSPYGGMDVQGAPRHVLSRGHLIVRDGDFVGKPGWGRFTPRAL